VRVLPHVKKRDDALGHFLVRVTCPCGTSRNIEPAALARIAGTSQIGRLTVTSAVRLIAEADKAHLQA
jgi:hypothetical protein